MEEREYNLVEIIPDPRMLVCEASELTRDGHYYLYRYNGLEGSFYRATVPSGAAGIQFRVLKATDKIPLGGWKVIEKNRFSKNQLQLVTQEQKRSVDSSIHDPKGTTFSDGTE